MWLRKLTPWDISRHQDVYNIPPVAERPKPPTKRRTRAKVPRDSDESSSNSDHESRPQKEEVGIDSFKNVGSDFDEGMYYDSDSEGEKVLPAVSDSEEKGRRGVEDGDSDDASHTESEHPYDDERDEYSDDGAESDDAEQDADHEAVATAGALATRSRAGKNIKQEAGKPADLLARGTNNSASVNERARLDIKNVARETGASATLPNELIAYTFLFVRGPLASGALSAVRLVCRRWRAAVDAFVPFEKSREPYSSAYQLGYLTPGGLMPVRPAGDVAAALETVIRQAATGSHSEIFEWVRDFLPSAPSLPKAQRARLATMVKDVRLRVASGA